MKFRNLENKSAIFRLGTVLLEVKFPKKFWNLEKKSEIFQFRTVFFSPFSNPQCLDYNIFACMQMLSRLVMDFYASFFFFFFY